MTTVILCGGRGTRAYPHTVELPKPLLDVAGTPILRHVMDIYAVQGFQRFILAAGFKVNAIRSFASTVPRDWRVEVVDTGEETKTGARVTRCRDRLDSSFFLTYADGLGNVNLHELLSFHRQHAKSATVTVVPLPSQYGTIEIDRGARVKEFVEKPSLSDHWINAGFFAMDPAVFDHWKGEDLEREVLPELSKLGELYAYRHAGFWKSMDTYKDSLILTALYLDSANHRRKRPPWLTSLRRPS